MDKESFELRQEWATSNIKNINKEIIENIEKIQFHEKRISMLEEDKQRYKRILNSID